MSTDTIISKVQKLLRLSTSSNANEAALAASKAQELIDRHQLSQAMLTIESAEPSRGLDDEPIMNFNDAPLDSTAKRLDRWRCALASTISRWNACEVWCEGANLMLIGRPSDAETVRYLYAWMAREVERLTTQSGQGKGRTWRNNFRLGVVDTIAKKLRAQHDAFELDVRKEACAESSQSLMRVNQALATIHERRFEVAKWTKENVKLYSRGGSAASYDHSAREAGRKAGNSLSMSRAKTSFVSGAKGLPAAVNS